MNANGDRLRTIERNLTSALDNLYTARDLMEDADPASLYNAVSDALSITEDAANFVRRLLEQEVT